MSKDLDVSKSSDYPQLANKLLDAADEASTQNEITYLLDPTGQRYAAIVPVEVADNEEHRIEEVLRTPVATSIGTPMVDGTARRFCSREIQPDGMRLYITAAELTGDNHQRVIAWMGSAGQHASWDVARGLLSFGGPRGSYTIPAGWFVAYVDDVQRAGHGTGFDGWSPEEFDAKWILATEQDRLDRQAAVALSSMRRRR